MTPDLAIGHALGALVLDIAKGMAAVAVALACVFIGGILDGFYHEQRARRRIEGARISSISELMREDAKRIALWERDRGKDDAWRRGNGVDY